MTSPVAAWKKVWKFFREVPWSALLPACVVLVSGGWVADGLKGEVLFPGVMDRVGMPGHWWPGMAVAGLCFVVATLLVYGMRRHFVPVKSLSRHECEPHRSLILFISPTPNEPEFLDPPPSIKVTQDVPRKNKGTGKVEVEVTVAELEAKPESLRKDIEELNKLRWNWQPLLRAIATHTVEDKPERLHLIGSPDLGGSHRQLDMCERVLRRYLPNVETVTRRGPVDFEDFSALQKCLRAIIEEEKQAGLRDEDIVIDVTGGQKPTSIAGSSVTFSTNVTFQYVQPRSPHRVYAYDVVNLAPER